MCFGGTADNFETSHFNMGLLPTTEDSSHELSWPALYAVQWTEASDHVFGRQGNVKLLQKGVPPYSVSGCLFLWTTLWH